MCLWIGTGVKRGSRGLGVVGLTRRGWKKNWGVAGEGMVFFTGPGMEKLLIVRRENADRGSWLIEFRSGEILGGIHLRRRGGRGVSAMGGQGGIGMMLKKRNEVIGTWLGRRPFGVEG